MPLEFEGDGKATSDILSIGSDPDMGFDASINGRLIDAVDTEEVEVEVRRIRT